MFVTEYTYFVALHRPIYTEPRVFGGMIISLMDKTNQDYKIATNGGIIHIANGYAAHYDVSNNNNNNNNKALFQAHMAHKMNTNVCKNTQCASGLCHR